MDCPVCSDFDIRKLRRRPSADTDAFSELLGAAGRGCRPCRLVQRVVEQTLDAESFSKVTQINFNYFPDTDPDDPSFTTGLAPLFRVVLGFEEGYWVEKYLVEEDGRWVEKYGPPWEIELYTLPGDASPWKNIPSREHVPLSSDSSSSAAWAMKKLDECQNTHDETCRPVSETALPTRVVDVGFNEASVRVVDTGGALGSYVTLSHRWGDPAHMTCKLTVHTLQSYKNGIPVHLMPRTFQDAIRFTRLLGIRYIWIDSLCIIQRDYEKDSAEDAKVSSDNWEYEAARMCSVYANSALTIAAAAADDSRQGLYFTSRSQYVKVEETDCDGSKYRVFAAPRISHEPSEFPLIHRGWVFQETVLSPRTLYFGRDELLWQCRDGARCQCLSVRGSSLLRHCMKLPSMEDVSQEEDPIAYNQWGRWPDLVSSYSLMQLTFATDKLKAVEGLAQYMRTVKTSRYLSGLWEDSLLTDLLWTSSNSPWVVEQRPDPSGRAAGLPGRWMFPTWSWASINGKVSWTSSAHKHFLPEDDLFLGDELGDYVPYLELAGKQGISGGQIEQRSQDTIRKLQLRGTLIPTDRFIQSIDELAKHEFTPDYDTQHPGLGFISRDTTLHCLRVARATNGASGVHKYWSLALLCIDEANQIYERIGLLESDEYRGVNPEKPPAWWGDGIGLEEVTITLC